MARHWRDVDQVIHCDGPDGVDYTERDGCRFEIRPVKDGTFWLIVHKRDGRQFLVGIHSSPELARHQADVQPVDDETLRRLREDPSPAPSAGFAETLR